MEMAIGFFFVMLVICLFLFLLAFAYKNRAWIGKWLDAPYYAEEDRELRLRRELEDCQRELDHIEKRKIATED